MSFLTKVVSPALHEAAVRAGVRSGAQALAAGFVLPAGLTMAFTQEWVVALLIGLALALVSAVVTGIQSYASFIAKGIPDAYVTAAVEQADYVPRHVAYNPEQPRAPSIVTETPVSSALGDAPIE
jgi:hypothetical protein